MLIARTRVRTSVGLRKAKIVTMLLKYLVISSAGCLRGMCNSTRIQSNNAARRMNEKFGVVFCL